MDAKVIWKQGLSFTGSADTGFSIPLGAGPESGGANDGFRPLELMAVSLAGCTAMDVISILLKKGQEVTSFEVGVHAERATDHPKVFIRAVITYRVTGHHIQQPALQRAIELSATKYCPSQAMLGKVFPIELVYEIYEDKGRNRADFILQGSYPTRST